MPTYVRSSVCGVGMLAHVPSYRDQVKLLTLSTCG